MSSNDRIHRDKPDRVEPIRNFSELYKSDTGSDRPVGPATPGNTTSEGQKHSQDEGVGLAYRVIEKHISDGKKNAGLFNGQHYTRGTTDRVQELLERTIRSQSELIPLWIEALGSAFRIDPLSTFNKTGSAKSTETNHGASLHSSNAIQIEVASVRPILVSIKFHQVCETTPQVTLRRTLDETSLQLINVSFAYDIASGATKARISIPDTHPSGIYSGVIVSRETGEPTGTMSIRIAD